ncbi:MAG: selenium cofactor biosynthesis protein YqeC [Thermodesulfobacteriota bacterium]
MKEKEREGNSVLIEALDLREREVISLAGAGGKTTLMFRLAMELFLAGKKVVTTTTTKIFEPASGETRSLFIHADEEELRQFVYKHLDEDRHVTIARERLGSGKLRGVSSNLVDDLSRSDRVDHLIVEADGAAGRPVKAPREGEPVIPSSTTLVVAVLGVDGVEKELNEENVFQAERVSKMTGIPIGSKMTDEAMALLVTHPEGIFKGAPSSSRVIVFLNKADIPGRIIRAKEIAQDIIRRKHPRIERVIWGQLRNEPPVAEVVWRG